MALILSNPMGKHRKNKGRETAATRGQSSAGGETKHNEGTESFFTSVCVRGQRRWRMFSCRELAFQGGAQLRSEADPSGLVGLTQSGSNKSNPKWAAGISRGFLMCVMNRLTHADRCYGSRYSERSFQRVQRERDKKVESQA